MIIKNQKLEALVGAAAKKNSHLDDWVLINKKLTILK